MEVSTTNTTTQVSKAETDRTKLTGDLHSFLKLLTTQLKYQDPLDPLSSSEFTAQLAQFAGVEQSIQTNANLETLIALNSSNQALTAVGYLGKYVEAKGNGGTLANGRADFAYAIPSNATAVAITVRNEVGNTIFVKPGNLSMGRHDFVWDGTNQQGDAQPEGKYTITVNAVDADSAPLNVQTYTVGIADGADSSGDAIMVSINGIGVPMADIVIIKENAPSL